MSEETKELIKEIKNSIKLMKDVKPVTDGIVLKITGYNVKLLLDYINELETNRDKAIKYIKENVYENDNDCGYYWWEITSKDELLEILKGEK